MSEYRPEWYGNRSSVVNKSKDMIVIDYGCPGKGEVICYDLAEGVHLMFQDMETDTVFPSNSFGTDIISVNYCLKGRQESTFRSNTVSYTPEQHMSVNGTGFLPEYFCFPLKVYKGISVVIERDRLKDETRKLFSYFSISPDEIEARLKLKEKWFICLPGKRIQNIFFELEEMKNSADVTYLRLKALELLYLITGMENTAEDSHEYFPKRLIDITKSIRESMISDTFQRTPIEEYTSHYKINTALFHKIFLQIYGDTPYVHLKKYRMNIAAGMLCGTDMKICDIAAESGYSNASKFSGAFSSVYGMTPREYRKKNKK